MNRSVAELTVIHPCQFPSLDNWIWPWKLLPSGRVTEGSLGALCTVWNFAASMGFFFFFNFKSTEERTDPVTPHASLLVRAGTLRVTAQVHPVTATFQPLSTALCSSPQPLTTPHPHRAHPYPRAFAQAASPGQMFFLQVSLFKHPRSERLSPTTPQRAPRHSLLPSLLYAF